jgi:hypothetical protein
MTPDDKKVVQEALDDVTHSLYPYMKRQQTDRDSQQAELLQQWVARGPVAITPEIPTKTEMQSQRLMRKGQQDRHKRSAEVEAGKLVKLKKKAWRAATGARPLRVKKAKRRR